MGLIFPILIIILYSFVWFVPLSINIKRRKKEKPAYWFLFLLTLILEIGVIYCFFLLQEIIIKSETISSVNVVVAPIVSSILAGLFYYLTTEKLDEKNT